MSELRERMIADMRSQGLSASTQEVYLQGVKGLAAYYRRSPDRLDEKDVRRYLLYLRDERGVARGTYAPHQGGIRFLFAHTLDRDWPLFLKKESARRSVDLPRFRGEAWRWVSVADWRSWRRPPCGCSSLVRPQRSPFLHPGPCAGSAVAHSPCQARAFCAPARACA